MPRLRQVPRAEAEAPIVKVMYDYLFERPGPGGRAGDGHGSPGDWWTVFALVPDVLEHAVQGFGLYQSPKRQLAPVLRELAQARAGWAAGSQFVFSQHCKSLRSLGVAEERIAAVAHWSAASCFDETERLVLAYTDCLVYDRGRVPDGLFDALREPPRATRRSSSSPTSPPSTSSTRSCPGRCGPSSTTARAGGRGDGGGGRGPATWAATSACPPPERPSSCGPGRRSRSSRCRRAMACRTNRRSCRPRRRSN